MSYNIHFHPAAESEFIKAYEWYEEHLEGLGERFSNAIEKQIKSSSIGLHHFSSISLYK